MNKGGVEVLEKYFSVAVFKAMHRIVNNSAKGSNVSYNCSNKEVCS